MHLKFTSLVCTVYFFVLYGEVVQPSVVRLEEKVDAATLNATEELLELIVKINADPQRWEHVRHLLGEIQNYLQLNKDLSQNISNERNGDPNSDGTPKEEEDVRELQDLAKSENKPRYYYNINLDNSQHTQENHKQTERVTTLNKFHMKKEILNEEANTEIERPDENVHQRNKGENLKNISDSLVTDKKSVDLNTQTIISKYQNNGEEEKEKYRRYFTYRRVNGPLPNYPLLNKRPKAYIAVSVIAPKPLREDSVLENELRHLRQWFRKDKAE